MTDRKFDIAGFSTLSGIRKVRFANGSIENRTKVLERNDHTDIDLRKLPNPMTKAEALAFLGVNDTDSVAPKGVQAKATKKINELKGSNKSPDAVPAPKEPVAA